MSGFVGLDPDGLRALAADADAAASVLAQLRSDLAAVGAAAQLDTGGPDALAAEVAEELTLLARLGRDRARAMELIDLGGGVFGAGDALAGALWASLHDVVGAAVVDDPSRPPTAATVAMSPTLAATVLADHLDATRTNIVLAHTDLGAPPALGFDELRADATVPVAVRAAAATLAAASEGLLFEAFEPGTFTLTADSLRKFAAVNAALATVAPVWNDLLRDGGRRVDDDAVAAACGAGSSLSPDQRAALTTVLAGIHRGTRPVDDLGASAWLTDQLVRRQVFTTDPDLAAAWVDVAVRAPSRHVHPATWTDQPGRQAWLAAATASTEDPDRQVELLAGLASLVVAVPPQDGAADAAHLVFDVTGTLDPTPISDTLSAVVSVTEGDWVGAGAAVASAAVPGGGSAPRTAITGGMTLIAEHGRPPRPDQPSAAALVAAAGERFGPAAAERLAASLGLAIPAEPTHH